MYMNISEELLRKAKAGAEFVPIKHTIGGIKVYKKTILHKDLVPYMQETLYKAIDALADLEDEKPKGKSIEELLETLLICHSGYLGKPITNRDVMAYSLSKLTEVVAILRFVGKI